MARTVHVIGAGLAGLSAAVRLAGRDTAGRDIRVVVHEAAGQAGGRCRSYHDPALDMVIDNGNHLLLSANHAALSYLDTIGAGGRLAGPSQAEFAFVDLASGERWRLRVNAGRMPWWILDPRRRVPGTRAWDYLAFGRLLLAKPEQTICEVIDCDGPLYERLAQPLWIAALNTDPREASAALAGAVVRETLAAGGQGLPPARRPRRARPRLHRAGAARFCARGAPRSASVIGCGRSSLPIPAVARSISARTRSRSARTMPSSSRCRRWWRSI